MSERRSIARTTLLLLPLQIVSRGVEALLPVVLALWFGRNDLTDVYYFAWAVFALAGSLVFSAFQDSAVVPVLAEVKLTDPEAGRPSFAGRCSRTRWLFGGALALLIGARRRGVVRDALSRGRRARWPCGWSCPSRSTWSR